MDAQPIELIGKNGHYVFNPKEVLSLNGRFGSVFRGTEINRDEKVIVKFFNPQRSSQEFAFRFKAEALYAFGRDDIQDALDFISNDNGYFLVKKYIPGLSLKQTRLNRIELKEWKEGFLKLLDTLAFLHVKGIVHADIKPSNIIWQKTEETMPESPVLIDFGLARFSKLHYTDSFFSFIYSPAEMQLGFPELMGAHTDLYSLGITLYEAVTGDLAYELESDSPMILEQMQISYPLEKRDNLPADWFALINYMCQKPHFKKPHRMYSKKEQEQLVKEAIERRPQDIVRLKEMAINLSEKRPGKSFFSLFK